MMTTLMPYRTNRMLNRREMNPFDDFFRSFFDNGFTSDGMRVDVKDEGDHYMLEADMPGIKKDNLNIEVDNGILTISTEMNEHREENSGNYLYNERRTGSYRRSFTLSGIDEDNITAVCEDGVLKLKLPKMNEEAKTGRRIEVN